MVGDDPLQAGVFVPQGFQLLQLVELHRSVLLLPAVEGRFADVQLAGDGLWRLAAIDLAQDRYDLLRRVLLSFWHLGCFLGAQTLIRNGSALVRQVTRRRSLRQFVVFGFGVSRRTLQRKSPILR